MLTHAKRKITLEVLEAVGTLPVMFLILGAIVNLGMAVYAQQAVQNAANYSPQPRPSALNKNGPRGSAGAF